MVRPVDRVNASDVDHAAGHEGVLREDRDDDVASHAVHVDEGKESFREDRDDDVASHAVHVNEDEELLHEDRASGGEAPPHADCAYTGLQVEQRGFRGQR